MEFIQLLLLIAITALLVSAKTGKDFSLFAKPRRVILDSCALIDGRVAEIARVGFIQSELVIPQFILSELQLLADGNDSHKRERARYGLDIAHELQDGGKVKVTIDRTVLPEAKNTDDKLMALAKKLDAQLFTTDYNLSKVAAVEGVQILNVNELAHGLRPIALPGETLTIKIVQKGSNREQGVGYMEDGTMIVIEGGARYLGREVPVSVTRMHQTVAGKMVFGQVKERRSAQPVTQTPVKPAVRPVARSVAAAPVRTAAAARSVAKTTVSSSAGKSQTAPAPSGMRRR